MLDIGLIGRRIRAHRKERGLTQNEFAAELHVSFQAVSNWERGIAPPDLENLVSIASYFGIPVDDLLRGENEAFYLGVDGGGTKTEFALVSSDGHVVRHFFKGGCNPNDIGFNKTAELLKSGIDEILIEFHSVRSIFLGLAGISSADYSDRLYSELTKHYPRLKIQLKNDSFNLFAIDDNADMAVISGTGSVVFVRDGDEYRRVGGWGYLLDDAGSAYGIGKDALCAALSEEEERVSPSILRRLLLEKMKTDTVWDNFATIYSEGKPYIAGLAIAVFEAYKAGDPTAIKIIDKNTASLGELLNSGIRRYGVKPIAIASGGLFEHYTDIMLAGIAKHSDVRLTVNLLPPIYGACKSACTLDGGELHPDFYKNFQNSYGGAG